MCGARMINRKVLLIIIPVTLLALLLASCASNAEQPPPPDEPYPAPMLISPVIGAVMDNGRTDGKDSIIWDFDWLDVPGATQYRLRVFNSVAIPGLVLDLNGATTTSSSYHHVSPSSCIGEQYYHGWTWTVMAKVGGQWSDWSEMRTFNVEPVN